MSDGKVEAFTPNLGVDRKLCIANQKNQNKMKKRISNTDV